MRVFRFLMLLILLLGPTSQPLSAQRVTAFPGMEAHVTSSLRWGDGLRIVFSFDNNSGFDQQFKLNGSSLSVHPSYAYDAGGNRYKVELKVGTDNPSSNEQNVVFPASVRQNIIMYVWGVPKNIDALSRVSLCGEGMEYDAAINSGKRYAAQVDNLPIYTYTENVNTPEHVASDMPYIAVNLQSCKRKGTDVTIRFTVTNNLGGDVDNYLARGRLGVFGASGNRYDSLSAAIGDDHGQSANVLVSEIPVSSYITIHNVPASETSIALARLTYKIGYDGNFSINFKNLVIE